MIILSSRRPRPHLGGFGGSQTGSSGGPPGESSETIKATRSKSTRSSHLRSLLSSSVLLGLVRLRVVVFVRCCSCIERSDQIFVCVQKVGLELLHSTSARHVAGVSQVVGRHRHRRSMVHRRASTLGRHAQKSARRRSRSENENFA